MRQQRKVDLEKHVSEVNALLRKANGDLSEAEEASSDASDVEAFEGFDETPQIEEINREDEYIDEDKYTTVTIESVGISKEGFEKAGGNEEGDKENGEGERGAFADKKRVWTKEKPKSDRPKKKKKVKFRYESKAERKVTRMKQGAKNRAEAMKRKGK